MLKQNRALTQILLCLPIALLTQTVQASDVGEIFGAVQNGGIDVLKEAQLGAKKSPMSFEGEAYGAKVRGLLKTNADPNGEIHLDHVTDPQSAGGRRIVTEKFFLPPDDSLTPPQAITYSNRRGRFSAGDGRSYKTKSGAQVIRKRAFTTADPGLGLGTIRVPSGESLTVDGQFESTLQARGFAQILVTKKPAGSAERSALISLPQGGSTLVAARMADDGQSLEVIWNQDGRSYYKKELHLNDVLGKNGTYQIADTTGALKLSPNEVGGLKLKAQYNTYAGRVADLPTAEDESAVEAQPATTAAPSHPASSS